MERALTSSQIQLSSEMSKTARRLASLEVEVDQYVEEVTKYDKNPDCQNREFVSHIMTYKKETNVKITEIVDFFNCRSTILKMPRREFYGNWLSGKCHHQQSHLGTEL